MEQTTKITIIIITALVLMGFIHMNYVSALTNVDRYHVGINIASDIADKFGGNAISTDPLVKKATLDVLSTPEFQKHSDAYRNGYVNEVDWMYHMKLPYVSYEYQSGNSGPIVITPHYMGIYIPNN